MGIYAVCEICRCRRVRCDQPQTHKRNVSWVADWHPGRNEPRLYETFDSTHDNPKQLAEDRLAAWKTDRKRGNMGFVRSDVVTYGTLAERYWKEHAAVECRKPEKTTFYTIQLSKGWIGEGRKVSPLTDDEIKAFQKELEGIQRKLRSEGLAGATVNRYFNIVRAIFKKGVQWGILKANPLEAVGDVQENEPVVRFLEEKEVGALFATVPNLKSEWGNPISDDRKKRLTQYMTVLYHTGARPSSLEACSWDSGDVDFQSKAIRFTTYKGGRQQKKHTYWVPMDDEVLKIVMERGDETGRRGPVFDCKDMFKLTRLVVDQSGVNANKPENQRFTIYGLKHCFASHLLMRGASMDEIAELLGHTDSRMVRKHYGRFTLDHLRRVQSKINQERLAADLKVI